jgi:hypothetical protein
MRGWSVPTPQRAAGVERSASSSSQGHERASFDLKAWHKRALDIGGTGLDTLKKAVLGDW